MNDRVTYRAGGLTISRMRSTATRLLLVMPVLLVSCGGSKGGDTTNSSSDPTVALTTTETVAPTTTSTTSTTSTTVAPSTTTIAPTTTIDPRIAAGQQYLVLVSPLNCASQRFNDAWASVAGSDGQISAGEWRQNSESVRATALLGLVAETDFVQKVLAAAWPDDIRTDIDQLARASAVIGRYYRGVAEALTLEALAAVVRVPADVDGGAAAVIRAKLGLPSNLTETHACPG